VLIKWNSIDKTVRPVDQGRYLGQTPGRGAEAGRRRRKDRLGRLDRLAAL